MIIAVTMDAQTAVVGAPFDDSAAGSNSGSAYFYEMKFSCLTPYTCACNKGSIGVTCATQLF